MNKPQEDIERLIEEIERRPPIYQKTLKEYSDIGLKKQLWDEICFALVKDWNNIRAEDKIKRAHDFQKKWHNLRTCFARELRAQEKPDKAGARRRKYIYFDKLLFLLPYAVQPRKTFAPTLASNPHSDSNDFTEEANDEDDYDMQEVKEEPPSTTRLRAKVNEKRECYEEQLLKVLKQKPNPPPQEETNCAVDEETNFVLSLVPTLKSLPEEYKLQARIEILGVLQRLKFGQSTSTHMHQEYYHSTCSDDPQDAGI